MVNNLIPMTIVRAYRLIPAGARRRLFGGSPSSHLALAAMAAGGNGWAAIWRYGITGCARIYDPKKDWD